MSFPQVSCSDCTIEDIEFDPDLINCDVLVGHCQNPCSQPAVLWMLFSKSWLSVSLVFNNAAVEKHHQIVKLRVLFFQYLGF